MGYAENVFFWLLLGVEDTVDVKQRTKGTRKTITIGLCAFYTKKEPFFFSIIYLFDPHDQSFQLYWLLSSQYC